MGKKLKDVWFQLDCNIGTDPDVIEMVDTLGDCAGWYYILIIGAMRKKEDLRLKYNVKLVARTIGIEKKSKIEIIRKIIEDYGFF